MSDEAHSTVKVTFANRADRHLTHKVCDFCSHSMLHTLVLFERLTRCEIATTAQIAHKRGDDRVRRVSGMCGRWDTRAYIIMTSKI